MTKTVLICSFFDTSSMFGILNFPDKKGFIESLRFNRFVRVRPPYNANIITEIYKTWNVGKK